MSHSDRYTETTPKAKRTRTSLLTAARYLVGEKGVDGVTVMGVCDHAKVGRTSFYNYFKDIPELLSTIANEVGLMVKDRFEQLHGNQPRGGERLRLCLRMILQIASEETEFALLITSLSNRYPEIKNLLRSQINLELSAIRENSLLEITQEDCEAQSDFLTVATLALVDELASKQLPTQAIEKYVSYLMSIVPLD